MLSTWLSFFEVQVPSQRQMLFCGIAEFLATVKLNNTNALFTHSVFHLGSLQDFKHTLIPTAFQCIHVLVHSLHRNRAMQCKRWCPLSCKSNPSFLTIFWHNQFFWFNSSPLILKIFHPHAFIFYLLSCVSF